MMWQYKYRTHYIHCNRLIIDSTSSCLLIVNFDHVIELSHR